LCGGQHKPRTTEAGCLLVCDQMSSVSFVQRTFDWDGEMVLSTEEDVGTGHIWSLSKCVKKFWHQDKNWGNSAHWI